MSPTTGDLRQKMKDPKFAWLQRRRAQTEGRIGMVQELTDIAVNQILTVTEPARLIPQTAGGFQIQCWIDQSFDVEWSADFENWALADTVTNQTGTLVFEDPEPAQHASRYYRVVAN